MDGRLERLRQWKCKNDHLLGVIEQVEISGKSGKYKVSRLILLRQAIDLAPDTSMVLKDVDVIGKIEGTVMDIRCSVPGCGEVRTWWMGAAALDWFLESRKIRA